MKNKILPFVIGVLIGAIITTVGFLIYEKTNTNDMMLNRERTEEMMNRGDGGTPPDRPEGDGEIKFNRQKNNQDSTSGNI